MNGGKEKIKTILEAEGDFNSNDVLVNLSKAVVIPVKMDLTFSLQDRFLKNLLDVAKRFEKETGIFPLCVSRGYIHWVKGEKSLVTPLILIPCRPLINKVSQEITIELREEEAFSNPFFLSHIKKEYDLQIDDNLPLTELASFLQKAGFNQVDSEAYFLGNFHHHRYTILRELDELMISDNHSAISELLGDTEIVQNEFISPLGYPLLEAADPYQLAVFDNMNAHHLVIQGPPGTGKSQVLANLIGKILYGEQTALIVSEKRVALEVLVKKLKQHGLDKLCFIASSNTRSFDFLADIKSCWQRLEQREPKKQSAYPVSEQLIDSLQQTLDMLQKDNLIGGLSFVEFTSQSKYLKLDKSGFYSDIPTIKEWLKVRSKIQIIYSKGINDVIGSLSASLILSQQFSQLDVRIKEWKNQLEDLSELFQLETWGDVSKAMKLASLAQFYGSTTFKKYADLLHPQTKKQKRFLSLSKKYLKLSIELEQLSCESNNWREQPTIVSLNILNEQSHKKGLLNKWKFERNWSKYSSLPREKAGLLIEKELLFFQYKSAFQDCKLDLLELGIEDPSHEIPFIKQQISHYSSTEAEIWKELSEDQQNALASKNYALNVFYSNLKTYLRLEEGDVIAKLFASLLKNIELIVQTLTENGGITEHLLKHLRKFESFEQYEAAIYKSNYTKFLGQFPYFSNFSPEKLLEKCETIISEQEREAALLVNEIVLRQYERFNTYQGLLKISPNKLSEKEKRFRSELKKGKAILVKAFSKTRNLPTLRELFASEARHWIILLKPIWLSNPAQVAKHFPLQKGLFEHCIFDEASQIPLQNSLGSIYRSKHITVAGDGQQMTPSNYFNSTSVETIDLLHQASFHWKNVWLKHHYRSEHPGLIAFSNKHFYNNQLLAFPSVASSNNPVEIHFTSGIYEQGENLIEAKEVAKKIEQLILCTETLGIVAFSETQLSAIYGQLSENCKDLLSERMENDTAFFKALENVQGDECDLLIISFGYGKDAEGKFHFRFGPLSHKGGARRLNVLFSRAKKHIDLFTSVNSSDFKISNNEATDLIRRYLQSVELGEFNQTENSFFEKMNAKRKKNKLVFSAPYKTFTNAQELLTIVRVLKKRGWKLVFED